MKRLPVALLAVILFLTVLWAGYWFYASGLLRSNLQAWFEDRRAEGWQADYADFGVQGFPNRFDARWQDMALADPQTGWALDLPEFALMALAYRPTQVIAVWPQQMRLSTPLETMPLSNEDMRASLRLKPGRDLQLQRSRFQADALAIGGSAAASLGHLSLAMDQLIETGPETYRLGLLATDLTPPEALMGRITSGAALPPRLQELRLDATVTFDRPWDIDALNLSRPQPRHIALSTVRARWGELSLQMNADLEVDARGQPTGPVNLQARNWRQMLGMAVSAGALDATVAQSVESALGLLAGFSGNPATIDVTLNLRGGMAYLGPLPLGPAPVLQLR